MQYSPHYSIGTIVWYNGGEYRSKGAVQIKSIDKTHLYIVHPDDPLYIENEHRLPIDDCKRFLLEDAEHLQHGAFVRLEYHYKDRIVYINDARLSVADDGTVYICQNDIETPKWKGERFGYKHAIELCAANATIAEWDESVNNLRLQIETPITTYEQLRDGMQVRCRVYDEPITNARIGISSNGWVYICQNTINGSPRRHRFGYRYSRLLTACHSSIFDPAVTDLVEVEDDSHYIQAGIFRRKLIDLRYRLQKIEKNDERDFTISQCIDALYL